MTTLFNSSSTDLGISADTVDSAVYAMNASDALVRDSSKQVTRYKAKGLRVIFRSTNDGAISSDPAAFVDALIAAAPDADVYYIWNEVGLPDNLSPSTLTAMHQAETHSKKIVGFNVQTNQSVADWQKHEATIRTLTGRGHFVGVHLYLDGIPDHDAGGYAPLDWLKSIGANVMVTEYAPIWSIFNRDYGWLKMYGENPSAFNLWQDAHAAKMKAYGYPCYDFSLTDWPSDAQGDLTGFGTIRFATIQQHFAQLNVQYPIGGTVTPPTPTPLPPGTVPVDAYVALPGGVNLRTAPSLSASIVRLMPAGERVTVYEQPSIAADGYIWIRVHPQVAPDGWSAQWVGNADSFRPYVPPVTPTIECIDVSEAQGEISWPDVKAAGVQSVMIRAAQGENYTDAQFVSNITRALAQGLKCGVYHAVIASDNGAAQAAHFLALISPYITQLAYPPALDVELSNGQTPEQVATVVYNMATAMEAATGKKCLLYTAQSFWNTNVGTQFDVYFAACSLWVANWRSSGVPALPRCWNTYFLWQWDNAGSVSGVNGRVDLSREHP